MKIRKRYFLMLFFILFMLSACAEANPKTLMYMDAFEQILETDGAFLDELDYISIYINEHEVPAERLAYIQRNLAQSYDKKVYTYKKEEIATSGPYGKEDLRDHGIFMHLTRIEKRDDLYYIIGEKHYTRGNHPSVQIVITF